MSTPNPKVNRTTCRPSRIPAHSKTGPMPKLPSPTIKDYLRGYVMNSDRDNFFIGLGTLILLGVIGYLAVQGLIK